MFNETEVDEEGRLVVRCDDVPEATADLSNPECLRVVLLHLLEDPALKGVVLVHDREKAYGPEALAVLGHVVRLVRLLDQFAARSPAPDFPGFTAKEIRALCAKCEFRPAKMFPRLREAMLADPASFFDALNATVASFASYEELGCAACVGASRQDFRILITDVERGGE